MPIPPSAMAAAPVRTAPWLILFITVPISPSMVPETELPRSNVVPCVALPRPARARPEILRNEREQRAFEVSGGKLMDRHEAERPAR